MNKTKSNHLILRFGYYGLVTLICVFSVYAAGKLFLPLFFGFVIAYFLGPVVTKLEGRGLSRPWATSFLFLILIGFLLAGGKLVYPKLSSQINEAGASYTTYQQLLWNTATDMKSAMQKKLPPGLVEEYFNKGVAKVQMGSEKIKVMIPQIISESLSMITLLFFAPIVAFFLLIQGQEIKRYMISLVPNRYFELSMMLLHRIDHQLGSYLRGQTLDCIIMGFLVALGLFFLEVKYALLIGAFAGMINVVPYLGPIAGALPAIFLIMVNPSAPYPWWSVIVLFAAVKLFEDVVVYPLTVGKSLQVHPLLVILGILLGEQLAGILGMLVAIPLLGIIKVVMEVLSTTLKSYRIT